MNMDNNIRIRKACAGDVRRIMELLGQVLGVHRNGRPDLFKESNGKYTVDELLLIFKDENKPVFVAVDGDDNVLGYAFCIFQQYKDNNIMTDIKTLYIDDLCVDEKCRGKHIGQALYNFVLDFARDAGCYNVTLNVWACNVNAIKFYEAQGLVPQKIGMEKIL